MHRLFKYKPLNKERKQIRLIKITSKAANDVACSIVHVDLEVNTPVYRALSYTWGEGPPVHKIKVDRKTFYVRKNLYDFISMFRRSYTDQEFLWIDQLSINQKDDIEKSWQVKMMAVIYKSAVEVIAWLGPANEHTQRAVWFLELLQDDRMLLRHALPLFNGQFLSGSMLQAYKDLVVGAQRRRDNPLNPTEGAVVLTGPIQAAVWSFLNNAYWTRLWVVQEIMLARSLAVWWGEYRVSRDALEGLTQKVSVTYKDPVLSPWNRLGVIFSYGLCREYALGYDEPQAVEAELSHLIKLFCSNGCENKRDKVFGLMALVRSENTIRIDYSRTIVEVYLDAVRAMGYSIVRQAERLKTVLGPPDWESFIKACYSLGIEMLPDKFKALPPELAYNTTDAGALLGFDQRLFLNTMPDLDRGEYMAKRLGDFIA